MVFDRKRTALKLIGIVWLILGGIFSFMPLVAAMNHPEDALKVLLFFTPIGLLILVGGLDLVFAKRVVRVDGKTGKVRVEFWWFGKRSSREIPLADFSHVAVAEAHLAGSYGSHSHYYAMLIGKENILLPNGEAKYESTKRETARIASEISILIDENSHSAPIGQLFVC